MKTNIAIKILLIVSNIDISHGAYKSAQVVESLVNEGKYDEAEKVAKEESVSDFLGVKELMPLGDVIP